MNIGLGVKGVLEKSDRILVLFKPDGTLDLPGGRINAGESLHKGLIREIFEETELSVQILGVLAQWSFVKGNGLNVSGLTYKCQVLSGQIVLSQEHCGSKWIDRDEILNLISLNRFL